MENEKKAQQVIRQHAVTLLDTMKRVITNPKKFFVEMPRTGGFQEPLIFLVSIGLVTGIIQMLLGILNIIPAVSFTAALGALILMPIALTIFGFVGATIAFAIWKLMGSSENYETAYRCCAYAAAIAPFTALLRLIPYLGALVGIAWMLYLTVIATIVVHHVKAKQAWIVFGVIFAALAIFGINAERQARKIATQVRNWQEGMKNIEQMSPEEAGEAMGKFLKGLEEGKAKE